MINQKGKLIFETPCSKNCGVVNKHLLPRAHEWNFNFLSVFNMLILLNLIIIYE